MRTSQLITIRTPLAQLLAPCWVDAVATSDVGIYALINGLNNADR